MSHDARDVIEDLFNDAFNEHGPYGAGRDTPTQIAIGRVLDELKSTILATLSPDPVLLGEVREALERIALPKVGLQGIAEDYCNDTNAYNFHAMRYFARLSQTYQRIAVNALAKLPKLTGEEE